MTRSEEFAHRKAMTEARLDFAGQFIAVLDSAREWALEAKIDADKFEGDLMVECGILQPAPPNFRRVSDEEMANASAVVKTHVEKPKRDRSKNIKINHNMTDEELEAATKPTSESTGDGQSGSAPADE